MTTNAFKDCLKQAKDYLADHKRKHSKCTLYIFRPEKPDAQREYTMTLTDAQYARLVAWHLCEGKFNVGFLNSNDPKLYDAVMKAAEKCYMEATECFERNYPFVPVFDDAMKDAKAIREQCREDRGSDHTFKVFVDGDYYEDSSEQDVTVRLADEEVATIKKLVRSYDGEINNDTCGGELSENGLMPILMDGSKELYKKFYRAIYPKVFFELFSFDYMCDSLSYPYQDKDWKYKDVDYLMMCYGDACDFNDAFMCHIPEEWMPKEG